MIALAAVALIVVAFGPSHRPQPADHDAITVLASTATQVAIETVTGRCDIATMGYDACSSKVKTVSIMQGNANADLPDVDPSNIHDVVAVRLFDEFKPKPGNSYLVFASFDRGGTCISALYRYHPNSQTATFIESWDGDASGVVQLTDRTLKVPQTVSLNYVQARMNPSGGPLYPANAQESWCPGP
jgi:hypothetical protein